jgi:hypothetical protein
MGQMLDLVDAGDTGAANDLHADRVHPAYVDLQSETALLADREQGEATASMTRLRDRQHALLPAALVAGLVGMLAWAASCCWRSATSGSSCARPPPATTRRCTTR